MGVKWPEAPQTTAMEVEEKQDATEDPKPPAVAYQALVEDHRTKRATYEAALKEHPVDSWLPMCIKKELDIAAAKLRPSRQVTSSQQCHSLWANS
eukprot:12429674-Karenia_brevis.AAC.1